VSPTVALLRGFHTRWTLLLVKGGTLPDYVPWDARSGVGKVVVFLWGPSPPCPRPGRCFLLNVPAFIFN